MISRQVRRKMQKNGQKGSTHLLGSQVCWKYGGHSHWLLKILGGHVPLCHPCSYGPARYCITIYEMSFRFEATFASRHWPRPLWCPISGWRKFLVWGREHLSTARRRGCCGSLSSGINGMVVQNRGGIQFLLLGVARAIVGQSQGNTVLGFFL